MATTEIDEFTVDAADEEQHFDFEENQDGIDNENYQEHIDANPREFINMLVDSFINEFTVDVEDEEQHFYFEENQDGIDNENYQEHIDEEEVKEDINDLKDSEDIDEIVNNLLVEMVEIVCGDIASEAIAGGDAEEISVPVMTDETLAEGRR